MSNRTSAAIDCILMEKNLYIFKDKKLINESPLYYFFECSCFFKDSNELLKLLIQLLQ